MAVPLCRGKRLVETALGLPDGFLSNKRLKKPPLATVTPSTKVVEWLKRNDLPALEGKDRDDDPDYVPASVDDGTGDSSLFSGTSEVIENQDISQQWKSGPFRTKEARIEITRKAPTETTREAPIEITREAPIETTREAPIEITREAPTETTREVPIETTREEPIETTREAPIEITWEAPTETTREAPIETTKKGQKPKRPCVYCGSLQSQLLRHLKRKHSQVDAVKAALYLPDVEQKRAFDRIRKEGIFMKNIELNKSGLKLMSERKCSNGDNLVMCGGCHGFFSKSQVYKHKRKCSHITGTSTGSVSFSKFTRTAESLGISEDFKVVIDSFRNDAAGKLCQNDPMILLLGKRLWAKSMKRDKHVVMSDMRLLANIILKMREISDGNTLQGEDVVDRQHFETLSDAIGALTEKENGSMKSGLKLKIGYLLKKLIKTTKGHYIQHGELEKSVEIDRFSAVLDYTAQLSCELRRNSLRKPQAMPVEEDVSKLREFILKEIKTLAEDDFKKWDWHDFVEMRNLIVCRLTLFNARRGGEPARLTLNEWQEAMNDAWIDPQLVKNIQDPMEKALLDQFKLAYQSGKG